LGGGAAGPVVETWSEEAARLSLTGSELSEKKNGQHDQYGFLLNFSSSKDETLQELEVETRRWNVPQYFADVFNSSLVSNQIV